MRYLKKYATQLNFLGIFLFGLLAILSWLQVSKGNTVQIVHGLLFSIITVMKVSTLKRKNDLDQKKETNWTNEKITSKTL